MIVIDTSALIAIAKNEPEANDCRTAMLLEPHIVLSAGTMTETLIVAAGRGLSHKIRELLEATIAEVFPVNAERATAAGAAYSQWGKGIHPAGLNFGDCFAYALAKELACPLLYIGSDFARTDIASAIPPLKT